jgi:hypothetical protein
MPNEEDNKESSNTEEKNAEPIISKEEIKSLFEDFDEIIVGIVWTLLLSFALYWILSSFGLVR